MTSYFEEDNRYTYSSSEEEEEEDDSQDGGEGVPLKEAPGVQKEPRSWEPSFFYRMDKEVHHFVGEDILIEEALESFASSTWPAITALCQYLESHCKELDLVDKAVLEVASGTGLVSIVAALLGAWVTATDLPDALSNLRLNLSKNTRGKCRHTPQAATLSWSLDLEQTYPKSVYHYDYVLAADVVYHYNYPSKTLDTLKHFCQPGTTVLWANKVRTVIDTEFEEKFMTMFNANLVFEDGAVRIFMATHREEEEGKQNVEDGNVIAEVMDDDQKKPECDFQVEDGLGNGEGAEDKSEKEVILRDKSDGMETRETGDEKRADSPVPDSNEDTTDDGGDEEEEESNDSNEDAVIKPDPDSKDNAEQQTVKTFSWSASVISSFGKDTYHYVGRNIDIYECIDFNESADAYGAVMWPGALALCSFLEKNTDMFNLEDKTVLELGSGTGLVAIVASLLGAKVTATDLPNFLGNLRANVMRNTRGKCRHLPHISPLTWSFDVGRIYPSHLHRFDYVLAADVVYHHVYLDELLATMSHFCHPRTTIIWANKLRIVTDLQFTEKFKKEFNATLLAEDGDMKIYMGKFKM